MAGAVSSIKSNKNVELSMRSYDRDESKAQEWAKKEKFPWPHILKSDMNKCELTKFASRGVPHYVLIDKSGEVLATGKQACQDRIANIK